MTKSAFVLLVSGLVFFVIVSIPFSQTHTTTRFTGQEEYQNPALSPDFGKIPLYFVPNRGQVDETALFYANTSRYTLWLTKEGLVFGSTRRIKKEGAESMRQNRRDINNPEEVKDDRDVSKLIFVKANRSPEVIPIDVTKHKVNYFKGNVTSNWRTNIQTSRAVLYKELYSNIDLKVYGMEKQIEYDFVVKPGGRVSDIGFEYKDVEKTRIDEDGNLVIKTKFGELEHAKPVCYQVLGGERIEIQAEFKRKEDNTCGFQVKEYNKNYELIIDPLVLVYSTYLGGSSTDSARSIAVDSAGSIYVGGYTKSMNFPIKNPIQGSYGGGEHDAFITKINASGTALVYSTFLGGSGEEGRCETCIAVDSEGAVYVTGWTTSVDFPTRDPIQGNYAGNTDAFITKISSEGSEIIYSTYLGGSEIEQILGLAVDSEGEAYVTGYTGSTDFPIKNPIQGTKAGNYNAFITKINSAGNRLIYSTYLGGSDVDASYGVAVDPESAVYVGGPTSSVDFPTKNPIQGINAGGYDTFITKINASGTAIAYSTYLGGSEDDWCNGIAVDAAGAAYVTGWTKSIDFPTKNPIQGSKAENTDAFITKVSSSGTALVYSTYLGGSDEDGGVGIALDSKRGVYVAGGTTSADFPTKNHVQETHAGDGDIFLAKVDSSGSALIYSSYLGGTGVDECEGIAVDSEGAAYVTGFTRSYDFPTRNPIQGSYAGGERDAFIAKLYFAPFLASLTITAGSGGTTDPSPGTYIYDKITEVTIRAIPNSGYTFSAWSGDASGTTNPITIAIDSDKSITASFIKAPSDDDGGGGTGGCFIATACYGTPMAEEVRILTAFRDRYLMTNPAGETMVRFYETHSPQVADFIRDKEDLKRIIRGCLKTIVWIISEFF